MSNPLLNFAELPEFETIETKHVLPALTTVLQRGRDCIAELSKTDIPTWDNFALAMEDIDEQISRMWSPVSHLNSVCDSDELREAYQQGITLLTQYNTEVGQNEDLFKQYKKLHNSDHFQTLSPAQKKIIENSLLGFQLSGAELNAQDKQQFADNSQKLSELSNQFGRNVLDATQAWSIVLSNEQDVAGIPSSNLEHAKQLAKQEDKDGWLFNLQIPSYLSVMQYADNAGLRQQMYQAYVTRASQLSDTSSQFDNAPIIDEILTLRQAQAQLLDYKNYAERSLVKKMAQSPAQVEAFLLQLTEYAKPVAENEYAELQEFSASLGFNELHPWDISYFSEKLRQERYAFSAEQVKIYFPADKVLNGMFDIVGRLFQISIKPNKDMQVWQEDVVCFDAVDQSGALIGQFYADLYVRQNKRGGAWMDTCVHRRRLQTGNNQGLQIPVAYLTCNFTPPIGDKPALLTHNEVETLFHEFGHTLHHLLTKVDEMSVAGINGVAWDAVELPSQFLENWCWHEESLAMIAGHYETNAPLPAELLEKMRAAKNFQSGMQTLRQIEFALFDMQLHTQTDVENVQAVLNNVRQQVSVVPVPDYNKFQNSFSHIFAGGYAAGYYSYKWAEVLSADAFSRFIEEGLFNKQTGHDFLTAILERGGVEDPNKLFIEFRHREPDIQALLRQTGIV